MAKDSIRTYSSTAASNTDVGGVDIQGTAPASNMDDGLREIMSHLAETNAGTAPVDDTWSFCDPADATKKVRLDAGNVSAGNTRVLSVPDASGTILLANSPVMTTPQINDASADHQYVFAVSELAADRTVTLPLLTGNDEFVFKAHNVQAQATWVAGVGTTESLITPAKLAAAIAALAPASASVPVGTVSFYGGTSAPTGWLFCYGQAVSRSTYSALFTAIGTTYGVGDNSTTFNLPDIRGRVIAGKDDMGGSSANRLTNQTGGLNGDTLGGTGGSETHTLTDAQAPDLDVTTASNTATTGATSRVTAVAYNGGADAHNNVQPTIILNAIIYAGV